MLYCRVKIDIIKCSLQFICVCNINTIPILNNISAMRDMLKVIILISKLYQSILMQAWNFWLYQYIIFVNCDSRNPINTLLGENKDCKLMIEDN